LDDPQYAVTQFELGQTIRGNVGSYMIYRAFYNLLKQVGAVDALPPSIDLRDLVISVDARTEAVGNVSVNQEVLKHLKKPLLVQPEPVPVPLPVQDQPDTSLLDALIGEPLPLAADEVVFDQDTLLMPPEDEAAASDIPDPLESLLAFDHYDPDFENHRDEFH